MIYARWVPMSAPSRLVPPSWALTVELLFYALICLGLSRNRILTAGWLTFSIAAALASLAIKGDSFAYRYSTLLAGSLPFALGSTIYHWRHELGRRVAPLATLPVTVSVFCVFPVLAIGSWLFRNVGLEPLSIALVYLNIPLHGLIVLLLLNMSAPRGWKRLDKQIGDYSYPVYLVHYLVGLWVVVTLIEPMSLGRYAGLLLAFALTLPLSLLVSFLLLRWIDAPVERWRSRIKANGVAPPVRRLEGLDLSGGGATRTVANPSA
jgi:peptidoglycan/LPS O-acetylase OafA/YrhL